MSLKAPFPFPLQIGSLEAFCHPVGRHELAAPHVVGEGQEGAVVAGNGYLAIRVTRGLWLESDFAPASEGWRQRVAHLPWHRHAQLTGAWHPMADAWPQLFRYAPIAAWTDRGNVSGSPLVRVGEVDVVRLCHLQLIARLPRCEVHPNVGRHEPLFFRFSGGSGIVARDHKLHDPKAALPAFTIFKPARCPLDGGLLPERSRKLPTPQQFAKAQAYQAEQARLEAQEFVQED
jgi:hypothetical protein